MSTPINDVTDALLARYLAHEVSKAEADQIEKWIQERPENQKIWEDYQLIWRASSNQAYKSKYDADMAWGKVCQKMQAAPHAETKAVHFTKAKNRNYKLIAFLASAAAMLLITFGLYFNEEETTVEWVSIVTKNETKETFLPDGTKVFLNFNSKLSYPLNLEGENRLVTMEGEAFFDVKPDSLHPFIITVHDSKIRVLGTSFNVMAQKGNALRVDVETGKVRVEHNQQKMELVKGQGAIVEKDSMVNVQANSNIIGYKTQIYEFKATSLGEVVSLINNGYHADIRLEQSKLASCRLTLMLEKESLDTALAVISETLNLKLRKEGSTYWLEGAGCQ